MYKRITYIDALKGLAIILVVCGHIAEKSMGIVDSPFNQMYSSFHMPLFIFLSGLFAYKGMEKITASVAWRFLQKKAVRVLLPFMIVGTFYSVVVEHDFTAVLIGVSGGYWFLPALFFCMLLGLAQRTLSTRFGGGNFKEAISFFIIWGLAAIPWILKLPIPYWLAALKMFPYFMFGHWGAQYRILQNGWFSKQKVLTISVILYVLSMAFVIKTGFHFVNVTAIFAIIILCHWFAKFSDKLPSWLSFIGRNSLEIYVLHWFFLPKILDWGKFLLFQDSFNANFVLITGVCLIVSTLVISLCLIVATMLRQSDLLNYLCFGVKPKK